MKAPLSGRPESKEITFPVWRDERSFLFSVKDITGAFAMWAVRQSPYNCPDNLDGAIERLEEELHGANIFNPKRLDFAELSCDEIEALLEECFRKITFIKEWNNPKSGHDAEWVPVTRFSQPAPDDDFIDLGALVRNIAHTLIAERLLEEDA